MSGFPSSLTSASVDALGQRRYASANAVHDALTAGTPPAAAFHLDGRDAPRLASGSVAEEEGKQNHHSDDQKYMYGPSADVGEQVENPENSDNYG